jgi:hypothetical protein
MLGNWRGGPALIAGCLLALPAGGCYQPAFDPCTLQCGQDSACPADTSCGVDGYCHAAGGGSCSDGDVPMIDASPGDGGADPLAPVPRVIGNAYYSPNGTPSDGMSATGFSIATDGIVDGDLVLFIANGDNGSNTVWPIPVSLGFTQLAQQFYGSDGQTYVINYKIASDEPNAYVGTYGAGVGSSAATITLIAVSNVDPISPVGNSKVVFDPGAGTSPVVGTVEGVITTAPNSLLIYAIGSDWLGEGGSNTFTPPDGYTALTSIGDLGGASWTWTSQAIAYSIQIDPGSTGLVSGTLTGTQLGIAWNALIAIAPPVDHS